MRKSTRIAKRLLALFLVVLMSINTLGAVVSDNDGSAFITKAEFDSLKNDFQSQIDQYNTSIDAKIDGAIAAYLSGIRVDIYEEKLSFWDSYNKNTTLRFWNKPCEYNEMDEADLYYQWCCLMLWSNYQGNDNPGNAYNTTETYNYSSMNFWSPMDCNDARRYRLKPEGSLSKYLISGSKINTPAGLEFLVNNNNYRSLKGIISVFGANVNFTRFIIRAATPHQKIEWPNFSLDLSNITSNSAYLYDYQIPFRAWDDTFSNMVDHPVLMPLCITLNWNAENVEMINPCFDFVNGGVDLTKNIMTLDDSELSKWSKEDEIRKPYTSSGGEFWLSAQRPTSTGQPGTFPMHRNYFGSTWGFAPPSYYGSTSKYWDITWPNTDDNYIKFKRPDIKKFNVDKIINKVAYNLTDLKIKSYNGMPILKIDSPLGKLRCDLEVNIYNADTNVEISNSNFYFIVSKEPFSTDSSSSIIASGENDNVKYFNLQTGRVNRITFNDEWVSTLAKDSFLYGRIYPTTENSYAVANIPSIVAVTQ